jgi:hypothetical protein
VTYNPTGGKAQCHPCRSFHLLCPFRPRRALHMGCCGLLSESAVRSDHPLGAAQAHETGNVEAVRTLREVAASNRAGR